MDKSTHSSVQVAFVKGAAGMAVDRGSTRRRTTLTTTASPHESHHSKEEEEEASSLVSIHRGSDHTIVRAKTDDLEVRRRNYPLLLVVMSR